MLTIGSEKVTLGMPNVKGLYLGNGIITPVIPDKNKPSGTVLHLYDRVDDKATVAGFWTDGNGQRYAVCVADAQYRSGGQNWSNLSVDTLLPNYSSGSTALTAGESGTYNTDTILNNYTATDYPAFNAARNACTVSVDDKTFVSCLPNATELQMIYTDRTSLDTYDTTLSSYPNNSLSIWNIEGYCTACWTSNQKGAYYAFRLHSDSSLRDTYKSSTDIGVIPIFEIPVDENGTVITN